MPETEPLYYFTSTTYALEGLRDRRLKSTKLSKTNDPFELLAYQSESDEGAKTAEYFRWQHGLHWEMLCLSETFENPLMWGHYADKGNGICLGFKAIDDGGRGTRPFRVDYQSDRVESDYKHSQLESMPEDFTCWLNQSFFIKSCGWGYEKEWRMLIHAVDLIFDECKKMNFVPFDGRLTLSDILLGPNCEEDVTRIQVEELIKDYIPKPIISKTKLSLSTFKIEKVT